MTSESDSTPRRRPPTIDLKATEVESESPTPPQDAGAGAAGGQGTTDGSDPLDRLRLQSAHLVGAGVGVVAMLAIFTGLWLAGALPSRVGAPASTPAAAKETSARLDKIEAALATRPDVQVQALSTRLAATEAEIKALNNSVAALKLRLDDIATTAQSALTHADAATVAAAASKNAAQAGAQRADIQALGNQVAALGAAQKTLSAEVTRKTETVDDRAARMTIAAEALRSAVERGAPYARELAAVKSLGADESALTVLTPFAADGVPSVPALAHELQTLTPALLQASGSTAPRQGTFLDRLEAHAQKLVRVTPIDAPPGDAPEAVIARSDADAARGDLAAALAEIAHLPESARSLAEAWVKAALAREAAIAASRRIAADALAALAKPVQP